MDEYGLDTKLSNVIYLGGQVALDMFINVPCMYSDVFKVHLSYKVFALQLVLEVWICPLTPFLISKILLSQCEFVKSDFMT